MLMEMAHSKHVSEQQKTAAVSQQFESVLVKQFLKEALKPMFKGVFNEDGNAHRLYRHFLPTPSRKASQVEEVLEFPRFCNNNSLSRTRRLLPFRPVQLTRRISASKRYGTSCADSKRRSISSGEDLLGLRDEPKNTGVGLLNAQQQSTSRRPNSLLEINQSVQTQMEASQMPQRLRQGFVSSLASSYGEPTNQRLVNWFLISRT